MLNKTLIKIFSQKFSLIQNKEHTTNLRITPKHNAGNLPSIKQYVFTF